MVLDGIRGGFDASGKPWMDVVPAELSSIIVITSDNSTPESSLL
jgi:hypothetical protein